MPSEDVSGVLGKRSSLWEGHAFSVQVEGRGRDVVFLHGLAASPECWKQVSQRLSPAGVCSHLIHMRGFAGLAPSALRQPGNFMKPLADALADYIRTLRTGPVAVVGHSMGGLVALVLARDHPDVVDRVQVVDVPAFFSVLIHPFATVVSMLGLAEHARRRYAEQPWPQFRDELFQTTRRLVIHPDHVNKVAEWGLTSDRVATADVMAEVMITDLRPDMHKIQAPVDVVYAWDGASAVSRLGLDQTFAASYAGLRHFRKHCIEKARHYVMLDQPDAFYDALRAWLAR